MQANHLEKLYTSIADSYLSGKHLAGRDLINEGFLRWNQTYLVGCWTTAELEAATKYDINKIGAHLHNCAIFWC